MVTIDDIVDFLCAKDSLLIFSEKTENIIIKHPATILNAQNGDISFCNAMTENTQELLSLTKASLLIVDRNVDIDGKILSQSGVKAVILSSNARLDFIRTINHFFAPTRPEGIHNSAIIAPSSVIAYDVFVGPLCTVGERVEIGKGTVIHAGVHIYDDVLIGRNVTINSGVVIGADGFGYERDDSGEMVKFPHRGGVVIEDDVEIGANTCIDRGTLENTYIGQGTRIDNLVHIAHNVYVGRHSVIIANAMVGGGTRIGDFAWIAPSSCLRDRISIGDKSVVGLASIVTKSVSDGTVVFGTPAREVEEQKLLLNFWKKIVSDGQSED